MIQALQRSQPWLRNLDFQSANPSVVKSIKQRDLLSTGLRLYARGRQLPGLEEYQPDLVYYAVDTMQRPRRLTIQSHGTRMSDAYGNTGKEYLGPRLKPVVMPVYMPAPTVCTIFMIDDIWTGRCR
jgi:hypothetical protein